MKPAPFRYSAPRSRAEALALLAEEGGDAKVLAGGQSLVPALNFRLAQAAHLVDLNGIAELSGIHEVPEGGLVIGAMTRQRDLERSAAVQRHAPLLARAMPYIAHPQIRSRGTFGGSLAHADPAAELPAVAVALDAQLTLARREGERTVAATDFFQGIMTTVLEPEEMLVSITLPALPAGTTVAFDEVARRQGDYALAGAAAVVTRNEQGEIVGGQVVLLAVDDRPRAFSLAMVSGQRPSEALFAEVAATIARDLDPPADLHATAAYRRHLAQVIARRVLVAAGS